MDEENEKHLKKCSKHSKRNLKLICSGKNCNNVHICNDCWEFDHSDSSEHSVKPFKAPDQENDKLERIRAFKQECIKLLELRKFIRKVIDKSSKLATKQKKVTKSKTFHQYKITKLEFETSLKKLRIDFFAMVDCVNLQLDTVNQCLLNIKREDRCIAGEATGKYSTKIAAQLFYSSFFFHNIQT